MIAIDTDRMVQSFLALVQIDSVTFEERAINEKGIRCVNLAIGMTDIHTVNESIAVADLRRTAEIALALMIGA